MLRLFRRVMWVGVLLAPLVFWALPARWVEEGPFQCPSRLLLEVDCPGCGLTRATYHALHGDWSRALDYNPLVMVALLLVGGLWVGWLWREGKELWCSSTRGE